VLIIIDMALLVNFLATALFDRKGESAQFFSMGGGLTISHHPDSPFSSFK
jgi:hypothetical protein